MLKKDYKNYLDKLKNDKMYVIFKNDNITYIENINKIDFIDNSIIIDYPNNIKNNKFEKGSISFLDDITDLTTLTYDVDMNIYYLRYSKYVFKCNTNFTDKNIIFNIKQFLVREDLA